MARTTFYNDNKFRRYPFVSTAAIETAPEAVDQVPDRLLVGAGFKVYAYSGFVEGQYTVWLSRVGYDSSNITLEFSSDAPGLDGHPLTFTVARDAGETTISFADTLGTGVDPVAGGCTAQLLWMGFVVVGDTQALVDWAGSNPQTLVPEQHTIEPGLIQNLDGAYVRSVNLANRRRVRTTDVPGAERPILVNAQCLQGPIRFMEGKNCRIDYDLASNGLLFNAVVGGGEGEPCVELAVVEDEIPPDDGSLLSGGPRCDETIKTINGVQGPRISLRGAPGSGITVEQDSVNPHKINVTLDPAFLAGLGG